MDCTADYTEGCTVDYMADCTEGVVDHTVMDLQDAPVVFLVLDKDGLVQVDPVFPVQHTVEGSVDFRRRLVHQGE